MIRLPALMKIFPWRKISHAFAAIPVISTLLAALLTVFPVLLNGCEAKKMRLPGFAYFRLNSNPTTLDPAYIVDVTGGTLGAKIFNGLVRLDPSMKVVPDIAKSWQVSEDGLRYRFYLRDDVYFHSGGKLTAYDVEYSFKRVLSPQTLSPSTWVLKKIYGAGEFLDKKTVSLRGIRVIDDYTVEITLKEPFSPFLKLLAMPTAYIVSSKDVGRLGKDFGSKPSGTGPFVLKSWEPDNELVMVKNANYFDGKVRVTKDAGVAGTAGIAKAAGIAKIAGPAKVEGLVYKIIPEDMTAVTEFLVGNLDVLDVPASAYTMFSKDPAYAGLMVKGHGLNTYYLGLNTSHPPLDNVLVRRAIACAIDRKKVLDKYMEGRGTYATSAVPEFLKSYAVIDPYPYNPGMAGKLLAQARYKAGRKTGHKNGVHLKFYVANVQESIDIAEIVASYLSGAGVGVDIKVLEWSAYLAALNNGEADLFWLGWWADYPEGENFLYPLFHSSNFGTGGNRTRYVNHRVDDLIEKSQRALDDGEKQRLYNEIESLIMADSPAVFFWHRDDFSVVQKWVKGFETYPVYNVDKGTAISLIR
ncbi:MAG: ABC transporter substrate-binding protein [Nitrospirae bacterium]|nr:ABC transporter substrate-binding protein [Nitrospirota bacterium]